jgi:glycine/D-amino acid oxidase-like deaminating enzyme
MFLQQGSMACAALSPLASGGLWAQGAGLLRAKMSPGIRTPHAPLNMAVCSLPRVRVESSNVLRTIVGLRPYRPSGFVVRAEKLDDTLVIHNYGHGGAGISLSWGTAQLALQLGCRGYAGSVAVLGCGAVGLATARLLQESGYKVTIYAKALPPDTTSNIAGGAWTPFLVADPSRCNAGFREQMRLATELSYKRFVTMLGDRYGVRWVASYAISKEGFGESSPDGERSALGALAPEFHDLTPEEHPFPAGDAVRKSQTLLIEPPRYLQAMLDAFREASGEVVMRNIADRVAITQLLEKVVFNCTGLGAKDIFQDDELTPVRGQLTILRPQPEVDYAASHDELYMLPRTDGIVLGGTYELGVSSLAPDMGKMHKILARHKAFFDSYRCAV